MLLAGRSAGRFRLQWQRPDHLVQDPEELVALRRDCVVTPICDQDKSFLWCPDAVNVHLHRLHGRNAVEGSLDDKKGNLKIRAELGQMVRVDRGRKMIRAARQTAHTNPKVPNASAGTKQDQGNQPPTGGISWLIAGRPFGISASLRKGIVWWRINRIQFGSNPGSYQDKNLATGKGRWRVAAFKSLRIDRG